MLGDIEPISAQEFIRQMKEILKEERKNQTNEEWFNGLSTIEKAKALHKLHWEMQNHFDYSPDDEDYVEEYCLCWLKAVHRDD